MATYHGRLSTHLAFPLTAECNEKYGQPERVTVIGLGGPEETMIDETHGMLREARTGRRVIILPLGDLDAVKEKPNRRLIEDYSCWLHNFA